MKSSRSGEKVKLTSIDELLGVMNEESAMEIELKSITPFRSHPFKVLNDEKMEDLINSIKENGVITPVLIRPTEKNHYEMISGHRRMYAARKAGLATIPAIVREMSDDEAVIAMVDANIQREELLPSEKAFAYKMKLNAMKRQAGRPSKDNPCQSGTNLRSDEELSKQVGESARSIQRYIRLPLKTRLSLPSIFQCRDQHFLLEARYNSDTFLKLFVFKKLKELPRVWGNGIPIKSQTTDHAKVRKSAFVLRGGSCP